MDDYKAYADTSGCLTDLFKLFIAIVLTIALTFYFTNCRPYNATVKPKNGHPHLYQKYKHQ